MSNLELVMRNTLVDFTRVMSIINDHLEECTHSAKLAYNVNLVLEELLTNTIKYGHSDNLLHEIKILIIDHESNLEIVLIDDGEPFNPLEAPPPDLNKSLMESQEGGLGIHLVKHVVDSISYARIDSNNLITILLGK